MQFQRSLPLIGLGWQEHPPAHPPRLLVQSPPLGIPPPPDDEYRWQIPPRQARPLAQVSPILQRPPGAMAAGTWHMPFTQAYPRSQMSMPVRQTPPRPMTLPLPLVLPLSYWQIPLMHAYSSTHGSRLALHRWPGLTASRSRVGIDVGPSVASWCDPTLLPRSWDACQTKTVGSE